MMIIKDLLVVVRLNADNNNKAIQNIERVVRKNINVLSPATLVVLCCCFDKISSNMQIIKEKR